MTLEELSAHAAELVAAVDVPVSVDAERCFADTPDEVATTVDQLATTGASGVFIEDCHPTTGIDPIDVATRRVAAAAALDDITAVVDQVDAPVNVLALPGAPSIAALTDAGVRRIPPAPR